MTHTKLQLSDDCKKAQESDAAIASANAALKTAKEEVDRADKAAADAEAALNEEGKHAVELEKAATAAKARLAKAELAVRTASHATALPRIFPHLAQQLLNDVRRGEYSELAAYTLAVASAWSYSDDRALDSAMAAIGWDNYKLRPSDLPFSTTLSNDALLVETKATLLQDPTGKVVILCFRGTQPTNVVTWLSDMTFEMDRFGSWGQVHSGFYHGLLPVWPFIQSGLDAALQSKPVQFGPAWHIDPGWGGGEPPVLSSQVEALYICGHSLGAAQALIATALLFQDPKYACLREKLRGVYTFGTPKLGDQQFVEKCEEQFGDVVFRHIFQNDVITAMPPRLYGNYTTFGEDYVSTDAGWTHRKSPLGQPYLLISSALVSVLGWAVLQIPFLRSVKLPLSLADHLPWNYIKCSRLSLPFYK